MKKKIKAGGCIGESRYYLGEDNIIYVIGKGKMEEKDIPVWEKAIINFEKKIEGKINILIDLNEAGEQPPKTRDSWNEFCKRERIGKVALFGMHPVARVLASFVMGISKNKNLRFFASKEKALKWLKG